MWELTAEKAWELIEGVKAGRPRIHYYGQTGGSALAESLLRTLEAIPFEGAHPQEAAEMTANASVLMVDLGAEAACETMYDSVCAASEAGRPVILVITGTDLSGYRRSWAYKMLEKGVQVLLGNPREMKALLLDLSIPENMAGNEEENRQILFGMALKWGCICISPGSVPILSDGKRVIGIHNGVPALRQVTGINGCTALLTAVFLTQEVSVEAAAAGIAVLGICGEIARRKSKTSAQGGSGTFAVELVDAVSLLSRPSLIGRIRTEVLRDTEENKK